MEKLTTVAEIEAALNEIAPDETAVIRELANSRGLPSPTPAQCRRLLLEEAELQEAIAERIDFIHRVAPEMSGNDAAEAAREREYASKLRAIAARIEVSDEAAHKGP
jgi:hypothetical protein